MSRKKILTIKDWLGTNTGNIALEIGAYMLIERVFDRQKQLKLVVNRKPDRYSSRFGMMANLNRRNRSLSWGFTEMTLRIEDYSDAGAFVYQKVLVFSGVAVADSRMVGDEEELTFVFNSKGESCIGRC
ncbi:MAG: hypothetical protein R2747_20420 [Pyrinomonadaceae bacterium]